MYSTIPKEWRDRFDANTTIQELNDALVILHIPAICLLCLLMIVGVVGNVLMLCIYFRYPKSFFRVFILWLGVIDLIACCIGMPFLIVSMLYPYRFPSASLCPPFRFIHIFLVISSVFIFMSISVERHRAVCNMEPVELNTRRVHIACFLCCIVGAVVSVPAIFIYGESSVNTGLNNMTGTECFIDDAFDDRFLPKVYFIFQLLLWLVSLIVMVLLYIRIGLTLKWHIKFRQFTTSSFRRLTSRKSQSEAAASSKTIIPREPKVAAASPETAIPREQKDTATSSKTIIRRESKVDRLSREITEMLCIVTVVFILSFLPHLILLVLNSVKDDFLDSMPPTGVVIYNIFLRSFVINNMANPVIYLACQRDLRKDCAKLLKNICMCRCKS